MKEIWKDIEGFEGIYQISNLGNVRSLPRIVNRKDGASCHKEGKAIKIWKDNHNYSIVFLWLNNKRSCFKVHRLVAKTFIDNPYNKPEVDHIDGNKDNNKISNLRWVTSKENSSNPITYKRKKDNNPKRKVINITENKVFKSIKSASEYYNIVHSSICECCKGKRKTAGKYEWKYVEED